MTKIFKASLGVRFQEKMFRLSSLAGSLTDELLALRGNVVDSDDFSKIERNAHETSLDLYSEKTGKNLHVDIEGIIFTHDFYSNGGAGHTGGRSLRFQ